MSVKRAKFRVRRQLSCKNKKHTYYVEVKEYGLKGYKGPAFYLSQMRPVILNFKDKDRANAAAFYLHKRINRALPAGMTLLEWVRKEARKIDMMWRESRKIAGNGR
jgi:hypothetical protein